MHMIDYLKKWVLKFTSIAGVHKIYIEEDAIIYSSHGSLLQRPL